MGWEPDGNDTDRKPEGRNNLARSFPIDMTASNVIQILPHSLESEKVILGAILLEGGNIHRVIGLLEPSDFYHGGHREIFRAMCEMAERSQPIDTLIMKNHLAGRDLLEKAGGAVYISGLTDGVPTALNLEYYAEILKQNSMRRKEIQLCNDFSVKAYDKGEDPEATAGEMTRELMKLTERNNADRARHIGDILPDVYDAIDERAKNKSAIVGLNTGFTELNEMTGGLRRGDLDIIAARPSMGKTALCVNIGTHAALAGKRVLIFSLEMSREQIVTRILCSEADVNSQKIQKGYVSRDDWGRMAVACGQLTGIPMIIDDSAGLSIMQLRSKANRIASREPLDLIIVDYLQLMTGGGGRRQENRTQEVSEISRGLKALAKELSVPVLAASQLNRDVEKNRGKSGGRRPMLSDLRESGSLEQDADMVIFIHREEFYGTTEDNRGHAEIIIGKQRNGPTGTINFVFLPQYTKFSERAKLSLGS